MLPGRQVSIKAVKRRGSGSWLVSFREFSMHSPIRMSSNARAAVACLYTCPSTSP